MGVTVLVIACVCGGFVAGVIYSDIVRHFVSGEVVKLREEAALLRAEVRAFGQKIANKL